MAINSVSLNKEISNITAPKTAAADNGSKSIQTQIANKEQRLNRLSSNSELSAEEKAKERQELQKQIAELNRKLKLLRMEQKEEAEKARKEQEQKAVLQKELQPATTKENTQAQESSKTAEADEEKSEPIELPSSNVQKILVANAALQKNRIQNQVRNQKENTESVLEAEIKMDEIHNNDTAPKQEMLNSLKNKPLFDIETLNTPKQRNTFGVSDKTKVIVVE